MRVLLVEDDLSIARSLDTALSHEGFTVDSVATGEAALFLVSRTSVDVVILDIMLDDLDGWRVCRHIKTTTTAKVIMLTARHDEEDKLFGFDLGAEDYMTKPFSYPELLARIKALLRRVKPNVVSDEAIYLDLRIDRESMKVFRKEKEITLGPKEYKLLNFLIKQPKRVYSRDQLLEHVWGDDINVESRTVDVHITRLRQAINIEGTKPLIRTVRSAGYSLEN